MIWSPLPRTSSPITTSMKVTLAPLLLPKHLRWAPASVLSHCYSLCLGCSSSDIACLTPSPPSMLCSHVPSSVKPRLTNIFLKCQLSTQHPAPLWIILILLFFSPEYLSPSNMLSFTYYIFFFLNVVCLLPLEQNHDNSKDLCCVHCYILSH